MHKSAASGEMDLPLDVASHTVPAEASGALRGAPRLREADRRQTLLRAVDVEELIEADHPARAIWAVTGRLDWEPFLGTIKAVDGVAGRSAWDPRLLASVWIYAYSQGIGSAREVARRCRYDPAFQWLTGLAEINYHTLADFRVTRRSEMDELFAQVLGLLSADGLVSLERVMHDGTKIKACAAAGSFRREERLHTHLTAAREQVAAMGDPRTEPTARQRAARQRAQQERLARLEQAAQELERIQAQKTGADARAQARVSLSDPQARIMKQGDGGYAPAYNVQLSTDAAHGIVVGVGVSQSSSDYGELTGAIDRVEQNTGHLPQQVVTDGGFTSRENVIAMAGRGVDMVGPLDTQDAQTAGQMRRRNVTECFHPSVFSYTSGTDTYRCPAGHELQYESQERRIGVIHRRYRAATTVCAACPHKADCCPKNETSGRSITRAIEDPVILAFRQKMQTDSIRAVYRLRSAVAEFPNAWIKAKLGLRQFHVRGLIKVRLEALWAVLTYNIQQWTRLRWRIRAHGMATV